MTRDDAVREAVVAWHPWLHGGTIDDFYRVLRLAGFAIVPLEPTDEMIRSGLVAAGALHVCQPVWAAMIAAYEKEMGDDQSQV